MADLTPTPPDYPQLASFAPRVRALSIPARCWLCGETFYLAIAELVRIPHGELLQARCPTKDGPSGQSCGAINVFRRVDTQDWLVPGDSYDDQREAYWGILGGPNLAD